MARWLDPSRDQPSPPAGALGPPAVQRPAAHPAPAAPGDAAPGGQHAAGYPPPGGQHVAPAGQRPAAHRPPGEPEHPARPEPPPHAPTVGRPPDALAEPRPAGHGAHAPGADTVWPRMCQQFAMRILSAVYQSSGHLETIETAEQDAARLERLYRIDHAITRVRRQAENMQVLSGSAVEDANRQVTSLLDVVRAAASAIEHYPRVHLGRIAELAVVEYAADDVMRVLTELLDNATRFSPPQSRAVVSAHLTEQGSVLLRVEDAGIGLDETGLANANALLSRSDPAAVDGAAHLGLLVVARLAATHRLRVHLAARHPGGTTATVLLPDILLCEIPDGEQASTGPRPVPEPERERGRLVPLTRPDAGAPRTGRTESAAPAEPAASPMSPVSVAEADDRTTGRRPAAEPADAGPHLPRRSPASLRGEAAEQPAPTAEDTDDEAAERVPWYDDVAAFAAGAADTGQPDSAASWPTWQAPEPERQSLGPRTEGQ